MAESEEMAQPEVKDEPLDEEYDQALTSTTCTVDIKDEPDTKENLQISSVYSLGGNSDPASSTSTAGPPKPVGATSDPSAQSSAMACSQCKKVLMKGQIAFQRKGSPDVFCSTTCLSTMPLGTVNLPAQPSATTNTSTKTTCHYCLKVIACPQDVVLAPVDDTMKEFCGQMCISAFNYKRNSVTSILYTKTPIQLLVTQSVCSVCARTCISKHEVILNGLVHKMCSEFCFVRFRKINNLIVAICANCGNYCFNKPLSLKSEDTTKIFCNADCLAKLKEKTKSLHPCTMCGVCRPMSDMIDNKDGEGKVDLFCTSSCVMAYKDQTVSTSVSVTEDSTSPDANDTEEKPSVLPQTKEEDQPEDKVPVELMERRSPSSSEAAGTGKNYASAVVNGLKIAKVSSSNLENAKQSSQASPAAEDPSASDTVRVSFYPSLVKVKDEPLDEEYDQALTSTTSTADIKDEPDTKENLQIGSVYSVGGNSDPASSTSTAGPPKPVGATSDPSALSHAMPPLIPSAKPMACSHCKKVLMKGQVAFQRKGSPDVFCSTTCLSAMPLGTAKLPAQTSAATNTSTKKTCHYCVKAIARPQDVVLAPVDDKSTMKEFCGQMCLSAFNYKRNSVTSIVSSKTPIQPPPLVKQSVCRVCGRTGISKHEVIFNGLVRKMCSEFCFVRFCETNNLIVTNCANCGNYCFNKPLSLKSEDTTKIFCNADCLAKLKEKTKSLHPCTMCSVCRPMSDMIDNKDGEGKVDLFCTSSCVMAYKEQTVSTSGAVVACDNCCKSSVPAYHLAMSDTSVRNFCTLTCVTTFQLGMILEDPEEEEPEDESSADTGSDLDYNSSASPSSSDEDAGKKSTRSIKHTKKTKKRAVAVKVCEKMEYNRQARDKKHRRVPKESSNCSGQTDYNSSASSSSTNEDPKSDCAAEENLMTYEKKSTRSIKRTKTKKKLTITVKAHKEIEHNIRAEDPEESSKSLPSVEPSNCTGSDLDYNPSATASFASNEEPEGKSTSDENLTTHGKKSATSVEGSKIKPRKKEQKVIVVKTCTKRKDNKRAWDKKHYCVYCRQPNLKMARHLERRHGDEIDVALATSFPKGSKCRKALLEGLRNKGDYQHNIKVLEEGSGEIVTWKQPSGDASVEDYLPCQFCYAWFVKTELWKHQMSCRSKKEDGEGKKKRSKVQSISSRLIPIKASSVGVQNIILNMKQDAVTAHIRSDDLICKYGDALFSEKGREHEQSQHRYIAQKMRDLGRFMLAAKLLDKTVQSLQDVCKPSKFQLAINAARDVSDFCPERNEYGKPSIAVKILCSLKGATDVLIGQSLMTEDVVNEKKAKKFMELLDTSWTTYVSTNAYNTMEQRKWNKDAIPLTKDVMNLQKHLRKIEEDAVAQLKDGMDPTAYKNLTESLLAQVIVFNKKHEGAASHLTLETYRKVDNNPVNEDIYETLSPVEKQLSHRLSRIETRGKRGRKVPILILDRTKTSLDLMVEKRKEAGIPDDNPYLFARVGGTSNVQGCDCLRKYAKDSSAENPDLLRSTKLRRHVATLCQLLDLKQNELEQVARFMGHDIQVHCDYYQQTDKTSQVAKIGKLLFAMEQDTRALKGKHLLTLDYLVCDDRNNSNSSKRSRPSAQRETVHTDGGGGMEDDGSGRRKEEDDDSVASPVNKRCKPLTTEGKHPLHDGRLEDSDSDFFSYYDHAVGSPVKKCRPSTKEGKRRLHDGRLEDDAEDGSAADQRTRVPRAKPRKPRKVRIPNSHIYCS